MESASAGAELPSAEDRRTVWRWGALTAIGVVLGYAAVLLANSRHFYTDDTESQYAPMWVMLGRHLRHFELPFLAPDQWMTGNYTQEEAGLFNPPQLLVDLIAPSVSNLAVLVTVVKLIFSIIAALGVFRICREYGSRPEWAAVAGVAFPLTGWFLFFDEASWVTSLTGTAWMLHAWAASIRYLRGRSGPLPVFVYLYLAISVEYVFPAVEGVLMLFAVAVGELVFRKAWREVVRLALVAGCAGLVGLATYLPSMLSAKVSWRGTSQINNDQFLTVPWSESLNASLPSTLPSFTSWWGYIQPLPVTYIAWFLIPVLAFVDWGRARAAWKELTSIALFAIMFLMWTAGPGTIGPLRWPARVLPMLAVGLLILVCVLMGRFGTVRDWRQRSIAAGVLIGLLWVRSFSADPHNWHWHLLSALLVAGLGAAAVWLWRTRGVALACVLVVVAMFPIAYGQVARAQPTPMSWNLPADMAAAQRAFPGFDGLTLQLGNRGLLQPGDRTLEGAYSSLVFGNYAKDVHRNYVNGYTPNGHFWFGDMICMAWDSSVCPDSYRRVFATEPVTGRTIADLMKVDRVVLQKALYPDAGNQPAPAGWHFVEYPGHQRWIWVLERDGGPISGVNGRVADAHNVSAVSTSETPYTSVVKVSSQSGGKVVFARLGWPGYRVTLNGHPVSFTTVAKSFVAVDVPAGTDNAELVVTWRPPGWLIGSAAAAAGLFGLAAMQWLYLRPRRGRFSGADAMPEPERELVESLS
ncbi:DUF2339 domain-containing protein [Nocardia stercoris]|uniref:YfhO family protein n=1 Tax=Nocardia stercoris TaxID=2483361 RepID=A0A3M2KXK4_9NOCA|nr:hypothetical protein [Nocardia stercoris]RMI29981.1 hypothetical protein EBN03_24495 [Nocardia stercoris]